MESGIRRGASIAAVVIALLAILQPAAAIESEAPCIEAEPDRDTPVTDDDIVEALWVYSSTTNPRTGYQSDCFGVDDGSWVDFEITGVGDPDESTSFDSPDMTCQLEDGQCRVYPGSSEGGEQRIVAWVDSDVDDATVEADLEEGVDETQEPGAQEPDLTDVVQWDWSTGAYDTWPSKITIDYSPRRGELLGNVRSREYSCREKRGVVVRRVRPGKDRVVDRAVSEYMGAWSVAARGSGRYYARVKRVLMDDDLHGSTTECLPARSATIRVP